jgi:hypothetical protein
MPQPEQSEYLYVLVCQCYLIQRLFQITQVSGIIHDFLCSRCCLVHRRCKWLLFSHFTGLGTAQTRLVVLVEGALCMCICVCVSHTCIHKPPMSLCVCFPHTNTSFFPHERQHNQIFLKRRLDDDSCSPSLRSSFWRRAPTSCFRPPRLSRRGRGLLHVTTLFGIRHHTAQHTHCRRICKQ